MNLNLRNLAIQKPDENLFSSKHMAEFWTEN
jgi:hypothetical protein